ncbi:MAG: hypothetical protein HWE34_15090 [Methylocystaceae bacterium]|nr:hypothetical protein [Methylocystaceae bacterium]
MIKGQILLIIGTLFLVAWVTVFAHATTEKELMDPEHWLQQERAARGVGASGESLKQRAEYCYAQKLAVNKVFSRSARKVWSFSVFKPNGFMVMTDIQNFERKLRNASEYAYKRIGKAMHNGAEKSECDYQRDDAIKTMNCIMQTLPRFELIGIRLDEFQTVNCVWQMDTSRP